MAARVTWSQWPGKSVALSLESQFSNHLSIKNIRTKSLNLHRIRWSYIIYFFYIFISLPGVESWPCTMCSLLPKLRPQFSHGSPSNLTWAPAILLSPGRRVWSAFISNYHWRSHISGEFEIPGKQRGGKKCFWLLCNCCLIAGLSPRIVQLKLRKLGQRSLLLRNVCSSPCWEEKAEQLGVSRIQSL